ncbi:hypothetical protein LSTR_LSTR002829 [Laodelphax striatellus]|uniref:Uncharacterized protein n=1 Tax=Laodelphax striatellus TaxID=195883 RepID=A0A482XHJ7_LAOST|nr:hypothetical protein LSTR_LSTR002829 [Laodelphax striatellus]
MFADTSIDFNLDAVAVNEELNADTSGATFHLLQNISGSPLMFDDTIVEDSQHADEMIQSSDSSSDHDSDFIPQKDDETDSSSCSMGRVSFTGEQPSDNHEQPNNEQQNAPLQSNPESIRTCSKQGRIRMVVGEESWKRKRNPLAWVCNVRKT